MPVALITGASRGLGRTIARSLNERGWSIVIDARGADDLAAVAAELPNVRAVAGDVTDSWHRAALADAVESFGGLHLLVNNASQLGPSPQPQLADYPLSDFAEVYRVNVTAPLALIQQVLPSLFAIGGTVVNISSDAAVEAYPGWGGYGSAKAALDQLTAIPGAEQPTLRVYASTPATCVPRCINGPSRARTSRIARNRSQSSPRSCACSTSGRRAADIALATSPPRSFGEPRRSRRGRDRGATDALHRPGRSAGPRAARSAWAPPGCGADAGPSPAGVRHLRFAELPSVWRREISSSSTPRRRCPRRSTGQRPNAGPVTVHFSSPAESGDWLVEVRPPAEATGPVADMQPGDRIQLPDGVHLTLVAPQSHTRGRARATLAGVGGRRG